MAVIANTFLMLNMVNKIRFSIAQPITVIGFFISSFILIALVSVANTSAFRLTVTVPGGKHALTQGYYFACFAAGIYFIMASLMIFTVYGAITGKYQKEFEITGSQRTLMMQSGFLLALKKCPLTACSDLAHGLYARRCGDLHGNRGLGLQ